MDFSSNRSNCRHDGPRLHRLRLATPRPPASEAQKAHYHGRMRARRYAIYVIYDLMAHPSHPLPLLDPIGHLERMIIPKSQGKVAFYDARKVSWGDLFPHPPKNPGVRRGEVTVDGVAKLLITCSLVSLNHAIFGIRTKYLTTDAQFWSMAWDRISHYPIPQFIQCNVVNRNQ
ncbi:hypothetical protein BC936DRAFT_144586 [Jimgerdemannia flammicorona]|uniref:Uncharacterized protein n=1 Tax=Jimgerdemannia flammicorona TaxID=994334 RepID=A0A433DC72_9FUNG|nr:hypothetical protein BC936DRAFT_144586 [Jimgerdemannia flammicorona]